MHEYQLGVTAFYASFSFCALCIKVYFLYNHKSPGTKLYRSFIRFIYALTAVNLFEFSAYCFSHYDPKISALLLYPYDFFLLAGIGLMLEFSLILGNKNTKKRQQWNYAIMAIVLSLHASKNLIAEYYFIGYWPALNKTFLYPVYEIFVVGYLVSVIYILISNSISSNCEIIISRCRWALIGISPFCLIGISIIFLRRLDIQATSAVIVPIITVFLLAVCFYATKEKIINLSVQFRLIGRQIKILWGSLLIGETGSNLAQRLQDIEAIQIEIALDANNSSQKSAAVQLGISEASLSRKIAKYNINHRHA